MSAALANAQPLPLRSAGSTKGGACELRFRPSPVPTWRTCWSGVLLGDLRRRAMSPSEGATELRRIIETAADMKPEPPRPLMREMPPADPFPIDALRGVLGAAARAIHDRVQAPSAICGQSVLAAAVRIPTKPATHS